MVFFAWQGQFFQPGEKCLRPVVMEAQKLSVFMVGVKEYLVFCQKPFPKLRIQQIVRQAFRFLWRIGAANTTQAGQMPQQFGLIRKVMVEIPYFGGNTLTLIPVCFRDLQICGECSVIQQFFRSLRCICPADNLGRGKIARSIASCDVNAVLAIPCGNLAIFRNQAVSAVVECFQECRAIFQWLLLGELGNNFGQLMALISATVDNSSHLNFLSGVYRILRFRSANTSEARRD